MPGALAAGPKLLLADEPTTALDATVQIQVILLLRELQKEIGMATIFVTHDVGVAAEISDRIAVMYAGRIVETGTAAEVLKNPKHPYTQGLLSSTVQGAKPGAPIKAIPGMPPDLAHMPAGCAFAPRCPFATSACQAAIPELLSQGGQRRVACIRLEEFA
jgi:peptide/nickel transport system ATP-binding protein